MSFDMVVECLSAGLVPQSVWVLSSLDTDLVKDLEQVLMHNYLAPSVGALCIREWVLHKCKDEINK